MNYITEGDLNSNLKPIGQNSIMVPRFLFNNRYKKLSAEAKLLFSVMLASENVELETLVNESGFPLDIIQKSILELKKSGLIDLMFHSFQ